MKISQKKIQGTVPCIVFLFLAALSALAAGCAGAHAAEASGEAVFPAVPAEASGEASADASAEASSEVFPEAGGWLLRLVNRWHPIPENYTPLLTQLINGQAVDERCYPDLQAMMDDCRAAGLEPLICSSYRTWQDQEELYENKVRRLMAEGRSERSARLEAGTVVAVPGTSEHQLGLAVDIVDMENQNLDETQEDTAVQKWLMAHSWEYGWILRYPSDKSDVTGIVYEPWHYRYVGREAAAEIHRLGVCLEEYLDADRLS